MKNDLPVQAVRQWVVIVKIEVTVSSLVLNAITTSWCVYLLRTLLKYYGLIE